MLYRDAKEVIIWYFVLLAHKATSTCNRFLRQGGILFFKGQLVAGLMHPHWKEIHEAQNWNLQNRPQFLTSSISARAFAFARAHRRATGSPVGLLALLRCMCHLPFSLLSLRLFAELCRCYLPHYVKSHSRKSNFQSWSYENFKILTYIFLILIELHKFPECTSCYLHEDL